MNQFCYRVAKEETLFIDLPGTHGLKIKGILRGNLERPLVILIHGRPGGGNDRLEFLGARYLLEQNFSSLRLFLYGFEPDTRNLLDSTLDTHVRDFDIVVEYLRGRGVSKVFAAGHSYGGITILLSKASLDAAVLWDASHGLAWQEEDSFKSEFPEKLVGDINIGLAGQGYIEPRKMVEQDNAMGDTSKLAAHKGYPIKVITAPEGKLNKYGKLYAEAADEPKEYVEIPGAGHSFSESDEIMLQLFEETTTWFERFRK